MPPGSRFDKVNNLTERQLASFDNMVKSKEYTWAAIAERFGLTKQGAYNLAKERKLPPLGRGQ